MVARPEGPVGIQEARSLPGLRLLLLAGVPSPWSQAARGIVHVKGISYTLVHRMPDDPDGALVEWTGQSSYPAAIYEDERPRTGWDAILFLAERLAPKPTLIPSDPAERALFFGLAHEICGEMGLGWCRRLQSIHAGMQSDPPSAVSVYLGRKYGYSAEAAAAAPGRVLEILKVLRDRLYAQRADGHRYLMGNSLSALDIYWATFSNLVSPLPPPQLPLPDPLRPMFTSPDEDAHALLEGGLLEHRDFIYKEHLELPVPL